MAATLAASTEAGAPRLPGGSADSQRAPGGARAAELLQQEARLAARLFAAAGRRPPRGLRQAAASSTEKAARFSVPVSRMGDYLEVGARLRSMCSCVLWGTPASAACRLQSLIVAGAGRRRRGVRRCATRRWTTTSAPGSTATPLATHSCATSAQRLARSPALVRLTCGQTAGSSL